MWADGGDGTTAYITAEPSQATAAAATTTPGCLLISLSRQFVYDDADNADENLASARRMHAAIYQRMRARAHFCEIYLFDGAIFADIKWPNAMWRR